MKIFRIFLICLLLFSLEISSKSVNDSLETVLLLNKELEELKKEINTKISEQKFNLALELIGKKIRIDPNNAELIYLMGYIKYLIGSYSLASYDLSNALEINKNHLEALYYRGLTYEKLCQYDEAIVDFSRLYKLTQLDSILKLKARMKFLHKDYKGAISDFLAIKDTNIKEINHYSGKAFVLLNDYPNAEKQFKIVLKRDPENDSVYIEFLNVLKTQNKYTEILDICKGIYFKKPVHYDFQAEAYVKLNNDSAAIAVYNEVIQSNPSSERYYARGNIYIRIDSINKAIEDYTKSIELDATQYQIYKKISYILIEKKSFNNAIRTLNKAINLEPEHPDLFTYRGICQFYIENIKLAEKDFMKSFEIDKKGTLSVLGLIACKLKLYKFEEAKEILKKAMNINQENSQFYIAAAMISIALKDFENAKDHISTAKTIKNKYEFSIPFIEAYYNESLAKYTDAISQYDIILENQLYGEKKIFFKELIYKEKAKCFFKLKQYDKAILEYNKILKCDFFSKEEIQIEIALCYQALGQNNNAFLLFDQIVKINAMNDNALIHRGYSYYKLMQFEKAEEDLMRAVSLSSKKLHLINLLSIILLEQKKSNVFKNILNSYNIKMKDDNTLFYIKAMISYNNKDYKNTIDILTKYIGKILDNSEEIDFYIYKLIGDSYKKMNKFDKAYSFYDKALKILPEAQDVLFNKGETFLLDKKYKEAIEVLNDVLNLSENSMSYLYRAQSYQALNEKDKACKDFKKAGELGNKRAYSTMILYCN